MNRRPRILLADDHTMLLDAFQRLLEPRCEIVAPPAMVARSSISPSARCSRPRHLDAAAQRHGRLREAPPKNAAHEVCLPHGE